MCVCVCVYERERVCVWVCLFVVTHYFAGSNPMWNNPFIKNSVGFFLQIILSIFCCFLFCCYIVHKNRLKFTTWGGFSHFFTRAWYKKFLKIIFSKFFFLIKTNGVTNGKIRYFLRLSNSIGFSDLYFSFFYFRAFQILFRTLQRSCSSLDSSKPHRAVTVTYHIFSSNMIFWNDHRRSRTHT